MNSPANDRAIEKGSGPDKRIIIADDDRTTHLIYGKTLSDLGFEVLHAYDGEEAYTMTKQLCPDILLLDIGMPKMDGRDICQKLKNDPATRNIIIIMVTARNAHHDRLLGFELGADDYIEKPWFPSHIERTINAFTRKKI